jgi:DNA gyrase/topoisomerase IV subunit B
MDYVTNQYCEALKDYFTMSHGHLINGLRIMVIVLAGEVDFSSQTKERLTKLCNIGWGDINPLYQAFRKIFKNNQEYFSAHVARLNEYAESLMNISTLELIKQQLGGELGNTKRSKSKVPDNVADALSTNRKECELFIIEGDSAGTQLKAARNNKIHALLKLRGVPLNAINLDINTMLENEEMKSIVLAINCGVEEWHDTSDPRYGKIIIAADADVDGLRIASLVSGIIAKKMPFLIREGMVYIVETPIYQQDGKYIYPSDDVDKLLDRRRPFRRFKGLGELSIQDAKYTMLDPETRRLKQLTMEGAIEALEILTSTSARKELIINSGTLIDPYNLGIYA